MSEEARNSLSAPAGATQALWWGWIVPPGWWLSQFELRYAVVPWAYANGHRWAVLGFGVAALVVAICLCVRPWRSAGRRDGQQPADFIKVGAVWVSIGFAVMVAVQLLPDFFLGPCRG